MKKETKTKETKKKTEETSVIEDEDFESDALDPQSSVRYYFATISLNVDLLIQLIKYVVDVLVQNLVMVMNMLSIIKVFLIYILNG